MIRYILLAAFLACLAQETTGRLNRSSRVRRSPERGCQVLGTCSQICQESFLKVECSCYDDYVTDPEDTTRCRAANGRPIILYSDSNNVEQVDMTTGSVINLVSKHNARVAALDYHLSNRVLYWSDLFREGIYRTDLSSGETTWAAVVGGPDTSPVSAAGLAVDWIYNRLYWTNSMESVIQLSNLDGTQRATLLKDQTDSPADIVVYPPEGWMFWTSRGSIPQLEKAGMDGTNHQSMVSTDIVLPMGLALDVVMKRIFWADQATMTISSCDWKGLRRMVVAKGSIAPAFLAVFEDTVYWTDWGTRSLIGADKFTGAKRINLTARKTSQAGQYPYGVRVYHPYLQPMADNKCFDKNGYCSHLCLPAPQDVSISRKTTCTCPDHLKLWLNGRTCTRPAMCRKGQFACVSGGCVKCTEVCDGTSDCDDGSDETGCNPAIDAQFARICYPPIQPPVQPTVKPLPEGQPECVNNTNCNTGVPCSPSDFQCNVTCIPWDNVCNGIKECPNGEDESPEICIADVVANVTVATSPTNATDTLPEFEVEKHADKNKTGIQKHQENDTEDSEGMNVPIAVGLIALAAATLVGSLTIYFVTVHHRNARHLRRHQGSRTTL